MSFESPRARPLRHFLGRGLGAACLMVLVAPACADETTSAPIDLPTVLRLAGAQNLDVQIAAEKLNEARARHESTRLAFFPWIQPGVGYLRHNGNIQDTGGDVLDVNRQSYTAGTALRLELDLGGAIYRNLAARQTAEAAEHALDSQRLRSVLLAAQGYFDLAWAQASEDIAEQAVAIAEDYGRQLTRAVAAGVALKGDQMRVQTQLERNRLLLRQTGETVQSTSARLTQLLHLDPAVWLAASDADLAPLMLVETNRPLSDLVQQAWATHPDIHQALALAEAARQNRKGAVYGPLIPTVDGHVFFGGLGGGTDNDTGNFDGAQDYFIGLSWRLGPGGLFDSGRRHAAEARSEAAKLQAQQARDAVGQAVAQAFAAAQSALDRTVIATRALSAADQGYQLSRQRKEFGVGVVLEDIRAQQDLTQARADYVRAVAQYNKAEHALALLVGTTRINHATGP